jgi:exosome complex exonuclease RRP6
LNQSLTKESATEGASKYDIASLSSRPGYLPNTKELLIDENLRYPHPYRTEIEQYKYPPSMYIKSDPIPYLPFESTTATLVDTPETLAAMLEELKTAKEIAIDLEHHDTRSYVGLVSLMQISTRNRDWIVDTLKPWRRRLECLNEVFADPKIIKV